jgi:hypothetical protein
MPLLQVLPLDTSRPSVVALLVAGAGVLFFGEIFQGRRNNQRPGRSELENWTVFTLGPALGVMAFGLVLLVLLVQTFQGR